MCGALVWPGVMETPAQVGIPGEIGVEPLVFHFLDTLAFKDLLVDKSQLQAQPGYGRMPNFQSF